jgi:hypothetical protein
VKREERRESNGLVCHIHVYLCTHTHLLTHTHTYTHTHTNIHRDEDVYWKLRLLSYICKRRARLLARPTNSPRSPIGISHTHTHTHEPGVVKMVVVVFKKSSGRLPLTLEEGSPTVECGTEFR